MKRDLSKPLASTYGDPVKKMRNIPAGQLVSKAQHAKNVKAYNKKEKCIF